MRRRQVSKMCCLAESWYGESPEVCIALRVICPLTYLASYVSQSHLKLPQESRSKDRCCLPAESGRRWCKLTCVPCTATGEPQRAEGAISNTPPNPSLL